MKALILLMWVFYLTVNSYSQNVGIGTTTPQNTLHVTPQVGNDPLRVDGLNQYSLERNLFITDPLTGVVKHIHVDSLASVITGGVGTDNQNIDSLTLNGTVLTVYIENGLSAVTDLQSLMDSALLNNEWIDGSLVGLSANDIFAKKALQNGDTIVITENGRLGINTSSPKSQIDVQFSGYHERLRIHPGNGFIIDNDTSWAGGWSRGLRSVILGSTRGAFDHYGAAQTPYYSFITGDWARADWTNPDLVVLASNGNVGIATNAPTERLDVNGNGRFRTVTSGAYANDLNLTVNGTLTTNSSDRRLKTNINPLNYGLDEVLKLKPVLYNWKESKGNPKQDIGFIAQDVDEVIPESVFQNKNDGYYGVNYSRIIPVLTKAIQDQQELIKKLEKRITELEKQ